ncbi:class II aldolase/adducin family protein [Geitlerinema sp. PCC 9228]|jgi:ribulose-5-phosphate 4-epimerase/fuculose-1-phosphate aldolase|uniref:class II aldolase/adducin family protein n=1 Tax=Geitlerinema sp. PCC 9228 TaxID=111611 RepID=UPI000B247EED|nr:class II aldolase/adducin family protein [Geitlerinema sp. PCC 9228]
MGNEMLDEGVIKFQCDWHQDRAFTASRLQSLMAWRDRMYELGLIGVGEDGIGFGNISMRWNNSFQFVISGTQTGNIAHLSPEGYTLVTQFNIPENRLTCVGPAKPSSESLTHAAIYTYNTSVGGVIHVHHHQLWQQLLFSVPTTREEIPYGTPEMAQEIWRLFDYEDLMRYGILATAGHQDGVIAVGRSLEAAAQVLLHYYKAIQ